MCDKVDQQKHNNPWKNTITKQTTANTKKLSQVQKAQQTGANIRAFGKKNNKDPKLVYANTKAMAKIRGGKVF